MWLRWPSILFSIVFSILFSCRSSDPFPSARPLPDPPITAPDPALPGVATREVTLITLSSARSGGSILTNGGRTITSRGVVWSQRDSPTTALLTKTVDVTNDSTFISVLSGLSPNTLYYLRAYATTSAGTGYGEIITFTTAPPADLPYVITSGPSEVTQTQIAIGGAVSSTIPISELGVVWATTETPSINDHKVAGTGESIFNAQITDLLPSTTYYFRAYATNALGTGYGSVVPVTTFPDTEEGLQLVKLLSEWKAQQVTFNGADVTDGYTSFILTLFGYSGQLPYGYSVAANPNSSPWPSEGTWIFGSDVLSTLIRDEGKTNELPMTYSINESDLEITFSKDGDWVFQFSK